MMMKKSRMGWSVLLLGSILLGWSGCSGEKRGDFLKESSSDYNITETARRFAATLATKNYHLLSTVDHEAVARKIDFYLKPTLTVTIDNPKISSKLLDCNPTMSVDLPLRVGIYNELNGSTRLVYTNPEYWSLKHDIRDKTCIQLINLMARDLDEATDAIHKNTK